MAQHFMRPTSYVFGDRQTLGNLAGLVAIPASSDQGPPTSKLHLAASAQLVLACTSP